MGKLYLIDRLFEMLAIALEVIRKQEELLALHGIETADGSIERKRLQLLEMAEQMSE